jgi:hypothetical protein
LLSDSPQGCSLSSRGGSDSGNGSGEWPACGLPQGEPLGSLAFPPLVFQAITDPWLAVPSDSNEGASTFRSMTPEAPKVPRNEVHQNQFRPIGRAAHAKKKTNKTTNTTLVGPGTAAVRFSIRLKLLRKLVHASRYWVWVRKEGAWEYAKPYLITSERGLMKYIAT